LREYELIQQPYAFDLVTVLECLSVAYSILLNVSQSVLSLLMLDICALNAFSALDSALTLLVVLREGHPACKN